MHSFNRNAAGFEGYQPQATLIQGTDGNFYGATPYGGAYDFGTIFQVGTPGVGGTSAFNTLYQFSGGTNGYLPFGALVEGRFGMLYGTTYGGGIYSNGTVFTLFVPSLTNAPSGQLTIQTNTAGLCFLSAAGSSYQLQYGDTSTGPWTSTGDPVQSNGGRLCLQDPQPTTMPQRYYRILIIP